MQIKNNKLILSDDDIENIISYRLKEIQTKLDEQYFNIKDRKVQVDDLGVILLSHNEYVHKCRVEAYEDFAATQVINFVNKYVMALKSSKRIPASVYDFLRRTVEKNAITLDKTKPEWFDKLINGMKLADDYAVNRANAIQQNTNDFYVPAVIERCLSCIEEERISRTVRAPEIKTHWEVLFQQFEEYKRNIKSTGDNTINADKKCLSLIFELIEKKYLENLIAMDCAKISNKIYYIPKNWQKQSVHPKRLSNSLEETRNDNTISTTTVKKYLRVFKEFLSYAQRKGIVNDVLSIQVEIPVKDTRESYDRFTQSELLKIFNPNTFPYKDDEPFAYRYYLMILGLFQGCRLNELAQLYCDDIKKEGGIYCMEITDERKDQFLKNKASKRLIPIHNKVIELGFIDYVLSVKAKRKERVFYQLKFTKENHYTDQMSKWFGRYLDKLGIKSKHKVFHSFRHTCRPELRDAGVSQEYANALLGWEGVDTGERVYGKHFKIDVLSTELNKLSFPYLEDNFKKIKERSLPLRYLINFRKRKNIVNRNAQKLIAEFEKEK